MKFISYILLISAVLISSCRHDPVEPELINNPLEPVIFLRDTSPSDFNQFYSGTESPSWLNTQQPEKAITKFTRNKMFPNRWLVEETTYQKTERGWQGNPVLWIADFGSETKTKVNLSSLSLREGSYRIEDWNGPYFLIENANGRLLLLYDHDLGRTDTILTGFSVDAKISPDARSVASETYVNGYRKDLHIYSIKKKVNDSVFAHQGLNLLDWNMDSKSILFSLGWNWQGIYQLNAESHDTLLLYAGSGYHSFLSPAHTSNNWILGGRPISILNLKIKEKKSILEEFNYLKTHSISPVGNSTDHLVLRSHYTETKPYHFIFDISFFLIDESGQNVRSVKFNFDQLEEI